MKRKFVVSTVTSVRCEEGLIRLADSMDIPLSDALMKGILFTAEFKLEQEPDKFSPETHDLFLALQKKNLAELEEWLGIQKLNQKRIAEFSEAKRALDTPKKKIRVYARDIEQTIEIAEDEYDPEWHSLRGQP